MNRKRLDRLSATNCGTYLFGPLVGKNRVPKSNMPESFRSFVV
jgi:hypothetical protein